MEKRLDMFKLEKAKKSKKLNNIEMSLRKRKRIGSSPPLYTSSKVTNTKSKNDTKR